MTKALLQSPVLKVNMKQFPSLCCRVCKFILYQIQGSPFFFFDSTICTWNSGCTLVLSAAVIPCSSYEMFK